jgi:2,3-dihydroxyphenylpropionate 1,2-dioxygenase
MPARLICFGHGGLMNFEELLDQGELDEVSRELHASHIYATEFEPDLVVKFGNDHNSGFSLRLMPPFLIALRANALGDFNTSSGAIAVDEPVGRDLVRWLHRSGIDVATSYDALFDHGIVMGLDKLFGGIDRVPVIPVFTNCGGDLRPPLQRSLALGTAIGAYFRERKNEMKVLFVGSGGLSHDPPLPEFETSPVEIQQRMIEGTSWTVESLAVRTERVTQAGLEHGRGEGDLKPLNPEWDCRMLDHFQSGDLEAVAAQDDGDVIATGGRGASEIRNWLAAFAALRAFGGGSYAIEHRFYRALPSWITGFGNVHASASERLAA